MKQRLGAVARGFAVTALSGLLAAGGCISQRANESEAAANSTVLGTSRVATIDQSRALNTVRGLRSNMTTRTRYLGPANPASSYATGTTYIGSNAYASPMVNEQNNASPSVATNVTAPVAGPAYYVGTATGVAVNAGVAGTPLTGTAIVPGAVAAGNAIVGGLAPGAGVVADMGATVPAITLGTAGASAAATVNGTGGTLAQSAVTNTLGTAGTITSPGVAGPLSAQTFIATAPVGVAPANMSTAAAATTLSTGAGVAGTVTAPGVAGPVSASALTGTAALGTGTSTQVVVTPRTAVAATSNATITNGTGGARARIVLRPSGSGTSNATVNATTTTTPTGARIMLGATPVPLTRDASGRVVVTNQTVNQH